MPNLVSEIEIIYRNKTPAKERPIVQKSAEAFTILIESWDMNKIELQEQFKVLLLNRANACLGIVHLATGGVSSCVADPKLIFVTALKANASQIILAHNHPSGNLLPSEADKQFTEKIIHGGKLLEIGVLDHLVVTPGAYLSFVDEGLMPS